MKEIIIAACAALLGIVSGLTGLVVYRSVVHRQKRNRGRAEGKRETTKLVIWVCLINGFAWVWCSYILAYLDKVQIAESLSQVAVTEIIGVVLAYCIKSAVENLSKNNRWPDKCNTAGDGDPPGAG